MGEVLQPSPRAQLNAPAALSVAARPQREPGRTAFAVLAGVSVSHLLNDTIQSLLPALYPMFKATFALSFAQVGLLTLSLLLTASLLQPFVGLYTDRRPMPYSLVAGMSVSLVGLLLLSIATTFGALVAAAGLMGVGSAIFHPESSRIARMASGGRHGFAQSFFQVGGNIGSSLGPLVGAFLVLPHGQASLAWCSLLALIAIVVLRRVGQWSHRRSRMTAVAPPHASDTHPASRLTARRVAWSIAILGALYTMISDFHLYNRLGALILTYLIFTLPFTVWVLTSFMRDLPGDLEEAAYVDGATPIQVFYKVLLPLIAPALVTTGLLAFIAAWNEYLYAVSFIQTPQKYTVPLAITSFVGKSGQAFQVPWGSIMAATVIVTLPLIAATLILQRRILAGLTAGAVKG